MDRMSPQDAMFISVEDERNPMHIGNVSVFEGPAPSYGDLVRTVASHLPSDGAVLDVVTFQVRERIVVGRRPLEAVVLSSGVTVARGWKSGELHRTA